MFIALSHTLLIKGMTNIKAQVVSIIASLELVYGIVFTAIILGDRPAFRTIIGSVIIFGCMIASTRTHIKSTHND